MAPARTAILIALVGLAARTAGAADSCITCHSALEGAQAAPVEGMRQDVHAAHGLSCADCHGGDPSDDDMTAMDEAKGFRGKPAPRDIPGFCGRCHADVTYMRTRNPALPTDQLALYATSVHGQRLAGGDTKVATCVSCHGVHGILPPANTASPVYPTNVARTCAHCHADKAYMAGYDIPTDQFAQYQKSVHAELLFARHDLSAPTCNDCHGNHGAYPPGASSVAGVCGQCHAINRDLFLASPHKAAFDRLGLPECVACHSNHAIQRTSDDLLGVGPVAVCITCHAAGSAGYRAAAAMGTGVAELAQRIDTARDRLETVAREGVEMSDARFELQAAHEALVQSRNLVHAFTPEKLLDEVRKGQTAVERVETDSAAAFRELAQRRRLVFVPLAAFAVVLGLLYVKLRQIERDQ
jgi:cytochrome c3-like protein